MIEGWVCVDKVTVMIDLCYVTGSRANPLEAPVIYAFDAHSLAFSLRRRSLSVFTSTHSGTENHAPSPTVTRHPKGVGLKITIVFQ